MSKPFAVLSILAFTSCEGFLDRQPQDTLAPETYMTSEATAQAMVNGIYASIDEPVTYTWPILHDALTDDLFNYVQNQVYGSTTLIVRGQTTPSNTIVRMRWAKNWEGISRANVFIKEVEKLDLEKEKKDRLIGEAKFLRAFFYSNLLEYFGTVPLLEEPQSLENAKPARAKLEDLLALVYRDLEFAAGALPAVWDKDNLGRATSGAALTLKAKVQLFYGEYDDCAETCKRVMDSKVYALHKNYYDIFQQKFEYNKEVIFDIAYKAIDKPNQYTEILGVWPNYGPTQSLVDEYCMLDGYPFKDSRSKYYLSSIKNDHRQFDNRDPRLRATIVTPGRVWTRSVRDTPPYKAAPMVPLSCAARSGYKIQKWVDTLEVDRENNGTNKILLRYAEVLLMRAEALNETKGPVKEVYDLIDSIQIRAGLENTISELHPGITQAEMKELIKHERRVEFALEGKRLYDLRRWKELDRITDGPYGLDMQSLKVFNSNPDVPSANWVFRKIKLEERIFNPDRDYLWPIPDTETTANPNIDQNPGYPRQ